MPQIGRKSKIQIPVRNKKAYVVATVMGYFEGCNRKILDLERNLFYNRPMRAVNFSDHTIITIHSGLDGLGGINGYDVFFA